MEKKSKKMKEFNTVELIDAIRSAERKGALTTEVADDLILCVWEYKKNK